MKPKNGMYVRLNTTLCLPNELVGVIYSYNKKIVRVKYLDNQIYNYNLEFFENNFSEITEAQYVITILES
jgi:hypothetical protein